MSRKITKKIENDTVRRFQFGLNLDSKFCEKISFLSYG